MAINKPVFIAVCIVIVLGVFAMWSMSSGNAPEGMGPPSNTPPMVVPTTHEQNNTTPDVPIVLPLVVPGPAPEMPIMVVPVVMPPVPNHTENATVVAPVQNVTVVPVEPVAPVEVPPVVNCTDEPNQAQCEEPAVVPPVVNVTENVTEPQTIWYWNGSMPLPGYALYWNGTGFPPATYQQISANGSRLFDVVPWNGTLDIVLDGTNLTSDAEYHLFNGLPSDGSDILGTIHAGESLHWSFNVTSVFKAYDNTWGWRACYTIYVLDTSTSPDFPVTAFALAFPGETTFVHLDL